MKIQSLRSSDQIVNGWCVRCKSILIVSECTYNEINPWINNCTVIRRESLKLCVCVGVFSVTKIQHKFCEYFKVPFIPNSPRHRSNFSVSSHFSSWRDRREKENITKYTDISIRKMSFASEDIISSLKGQVLKKNEHKQEYVR